MVVHSAVAAAQDGDGSFVAGGWKSPKSLSLPGGGPVGGAGGGTGVGPWGWPSSSKQPLHLSSGLKPTPGSPIKLPELNVEFVPAPDRDKPLPFGTNSPKMVE